MKSLLLAAAEGTSQRTVQGEHYVTSISLNGAKGKEVAFETRSPLYEVVGEIDNEWGKEKLVAQFRVATPIVSQIRVKDGEWQDLDEKTELEVLKAAAVAHDAIPLLKGFDQAVEEGFEGTPADFILSEIPDAVDISFNVENVYNIVGEVVAGGTTKLDAHGDYTDFEFELDSDQAAEAAITLIESKEPELLIYQNDQTTYLPEIGQVKEKGESQVLSNDQVTVVREAIDALSITPELKVTRESKSKAAHRFG